LTGNYRAALLGLEDAERRARRLGLARLSLFAQLERATALQAVGRAEDAERIIAELDRAPPPEMSACDRANLLISLGWIRLVARDGSPRIVGPRALAEPAAAEPLDRALALFPAACADPFIRANALTNLAIVAVQDGDPRAARARLAEARATLPEHPASLALWWLDIEARIAVRDGALARAVSLFEEERRRARVIASAEVEWRASTAIAEALESMGATSRAGDEYRRAEALLDDWSLDVPLGEGRDSFLADRERSARGRVGLLVKLGRAREAMDAARDARSRVIRGLERATRLQRADAESARRWSQVVGEYRRRREQLAKNAEHDWVLPSDEIRTVIRARQEEMTRLSAQLDAAIAAIARPEGAGAPRALPGTSLLYYPIRSGWIGFVTDGARVVVRPLGSPPEDDARDALAAWLLRPFAAELRASERVRVLPYGALSNVDLHALPLDAGGEPLGARVPVEYSLDLRRTERAKDVGFTSLVVKDPRLDLPAARAEADAVAHALERFGEVRVLAGAAATHGDVLAQMAGATLFHFAGHGAFAGRDGWESALAVTAGESLTIGDLLSMDRAPRFVALSSCLAARSEGNASAEGLGIAHALVMAGAETVIAPTREVDDDVAAAVSRAFYAHLATPDADGARAALRAAEDDVRRARPAADWAAYRVLVP
jgi:CHAT domain-containing protein